MTFESGDVTRLKDVAVGEGKDGMQMVSRLYSGTSWRRCFGWRHDRERRDFYALFCLHS